MHVSIHVLYRTKLAAALSHLMQQRRQLYGGVVLCLLVPLLPHVLCTAWQGRAGGGGNSVSQGTKHNSPAQAVLL
jgi:hypothetical protein